MPDRASVLGICYVCAKTVWGFTLRAGRPYATSPKTRYAVGELREGVMLVRHSTCAPTGAETSAPASPIGKDVKR